jgi:hypothetical protein
VWRFSRPSNFGSVGGINQTGPMEPKVQPVVFPFFGETNVGLVFFESRSIFFLSIISSETAAHFSGIFAPTVGTDRFISKLW